MLISLGGLTAAGCGPDKSPDLPAEAMHSKGAQKSQAMQDYMKKGNPSGKPAPGMSNFGK